MSNSTHSESAVKVRPRRSVQFSLRTLLIVVTVVAVVAGFFRWRWLQSPEVKLARQWANFSQEFAAVPMQVGDWVGTEHQLTPLVMETYDAHEGVFRIYRHRITGATIYLTVLRGLPHPISIHTPYHGYGNDLQEDLRLRDYGLGSHVQSIQNADIKGYDGTRVYELQTYSPTGNWSRPSIPRFEFESYPELTKLQMLYTASDSKQWGSWQEFDTFVLDIFPHLQDALFPHSPGSADPHWFQWPELPTVPWLEGTVLFGCLWGLVYLSRKKRLLAREN